LAKVEELLPSQDGNIKAAMVVSINKQGKASRLWGVIQHLILLEVRANVQEPQ
jgi:hypothetical protein